MPKLVFLGTGTSTGVPQIGCTCKVCRSVDPHDRRLRTSALYVTDEGRRILIDCGPDFREQLLRLPFSPIDSVLLTHEHYDHVGGLDDLRPFSFHRAVDIFSNPICCKNLRERMPYCFAEVKYLGVPDISLHAVTADKPFRTAGVEVLPIEVMHDRLPIYGYRIGDMAYITDMSRISSKEKRKITELNILVVNALRNSPHHSHQSLTEAIELIEEVHPRRTFLIHMSHEIGLHAEVERRLPDNVRLAYDDKVIEW